MAYDVTFLKELRGLGEYIQSLDGANKIIKILERCIEIKRELTKLEKGACFNFVKADRKRRALLDEYVYLCNCGTEEGQAVRQVSVCYNYFVETLKEDCQKTLLTE